MWCVCIVLCMRVARHVIVPSAVCYCMVRELLKYSGVCVRA